MPDQQPQPKQPGLKDSTIALMIGVALFYDALSLVLAPVLMSWLVIPIFYLTFMLWFGLHGLNFLSLKRAPTQLVGFLLEGISAGILPAMAFIVARVALGTKIKKVVGI